MPVRLPFVQLIRQAVTSAPSGRGCAYAGCTQRAASIHSLSVAVAKRTVAADWDRRHAFVRTPFSPRRNRRVQAKSQRLSHVARAASLFLECTIKRKRPLSPRAAKLVVTGKVAMDTPVIAVVIVVALIVVSTLSILNKACKSGYHAWCAPISTLRHHSKTTAQ